MDTFDQTCFGVTSVADCSTASGAGVSGPCYTCLVAGETSSSWGVLILTSGFTQNFWQFNSGGCYAQESASELACAQATQYQLECEFAECEPDDLRGGVGSGSPPFSTCKGEVDAPGSGLCACIATSATAACASFASSPCALPAGGGFGLGSTFDQTLKNFAKVMCE